MLTNKLIRELLEHLCLRVSKKKSAKMITVLFQIIHRYYKFISPIYLIETAIFNLLIPVASYSPETQKNLRGKLLKQSIVQALLSIITYAKKLRTNQTLSYKLALIFIHLYKKDHILYVQKLKYLNKILNI